MPGAIDALTLSNATSAVPTLFILHVLANAIDFGLPIANRFDFMFQLVADLLQVLHQSFGELGSLDCGSTVGY